MIVHSMITLQPAIGPWKLCAEGHGDRTRANYDNPQLWAPHASLSSPWSPQLQVSASLNHWADVGRRGAEREQIACQSEDRRWPFEAGHWPSQDGQHNGKAIPIWTLHYHQQETIRIRWIVSTFFILHACTASDELVKERTTIWQQWPTSRL